ncbi:MAG: hypothetical protein F6K28_04135 [Microcoleus sp. SIO2G3]|nr:hypothetical protein [Microcoleus sp. SIO2G3]
MGWATQTVLLVCGRKFEYKYSEGLTPNWLNLIKLLAISFRLSAFWVLKLIVKLTQSLKRQTADS